jgi:hypothetical protein
LGVIVHIPVSFPAAFGEMLIPSEQWPKNISPTGQGKHGNDKVVLLLVLLDQNMTGSIWWVLRGGHLNNVLLEIPWII